MWKPWLAFYAAGIAVTALALLRPQAHRHDRLMNAASIVLWPFYWAFFLVLLVNQKRP